MRSILRYGTLVILPVVALVLGLQLGIRYEKQQVAEKEATLEFLLNGGVGSGQVIMNPEEEVDPSLLWAVWRLLARSYIDPDKLDAQNMLYGAARGIASSLEDPYTTFMSPVEHSDFRLALNGSLEGIGAELTFRDDVVVVVAPLKGSPALRGGLQSEDIIVEVDGEVVLGQTLQEIVHKIRGPKGTEVVVGVRRAGSLEVIQLTFVREKITVPSTEYKTIETGSGSIGYVAVNQFGDRTVREVEEALQEVRSGEIDGLIVDLRFNGGGYLEGAVDITSMFINQGKVVTVERRDAEPISHYVYGRPIDTDTPLVVMINEASASASEIVAGALQDHERATIVGKKSFGKGTIQEIFELPGGSSVRVTVARWLTPGGRDLGEEGIEPDIEIERSVENFKAELDPQLDAALEWLLDAEDLSLESETEEEDA